MCWPLWHVTSRHLFPPSSQLPLNAALRLEREGVDAPRAVWRGQSPQPPIFHRLIPRKLKAGFVSTAHVFWLFACHQLLLRMLWGRGEKAQAHAQLRGLRKIEETVVATSFWGLCVSKPFLSIPSSLTSQGRCWDFKNKCTGGCTVKEDWNHAGHREKPSDKGLKLQQDITFWYTLTYLCSKTQPSATRAAPPACPKKSRIPLPKPKP